MKHTDYCQLNVWSQNETSMIQVLYLKWKIDEVTIYHITIVKVLKLVRRPSFSLFLILQSKKSQNERQLSIHHELNHLCLHWGGTVLKLKSTSVSLLGKLLTQCDCHCRAPWITAKLEHDMGCMLTNVSMAPPKKRKSSKVGDKFNYIYSCFSPKWIAILCTLTITVT